MTVRQKRQRFARELHDTPAQGLRNKEIAARLQLSERTVKAYVAGVFNKLGVDSRAEAVAVATREGLLQL